MGGGPRVVVSTAAFHARVRGSVPGLGGLQETKMFLPHPRVKVSIVGSLCDREVACSASDRQGSNFESCVCRTVSSQSSHHPQEVLLAQFSLYGHESGLKPDSFHFLHGQMVEYFHVVSSNIISIYRQFHSTKYCNVALFNPMIWPLLQRSNLFCLIGYFYSWLCRYPAMFTDSSGLFDRHCAGEWTEHVAQSSHLRPTDISLQRRLPYSGT